MIFGYFVVVSRIRLVTDVRRGRGGGEALRPHTSVVQDEANRKMPSEKHITHEERERERERERDLSHICKTSVDISCEFQYCCSEAYQGRKEGRKQKN
jgi:hypothetical protein